MTVMFKAIQELLQQVFRVGSKPGVPVTETKDVMNKLLNLQKKFDELDPNDGAGAADLSDEFRQVETDVRNLELAEESKEKARKIIETESPPDEFFGRTVDIDELMKAEDQINRLSEPTGNIADEINDAVRATEIKNEDLAKLEDKMSDPKNFSKSVDELMQEVMDEKVSPIRPEKKATGGRIGFQDGSDFKGGPKIGRRAFLGGLGAGIASLFIPRGAAKVAATAAKAAPEIAAQGMPNWFPLLVNKIKKQGKQTKVATGGRNPENVYTLKVDGNEYTLTEDAVNGSMDVSTRGDDFQQVSFEYIPPTEYRRPDGKAFTEDSEFYASEFMKGGDDFPDYENTLGGIEDLKLGINSIEEFAKAGNKTPAERLDEIAAEFKKATSKEDIDGFAKGGRVGYKNGGGVGTLFKEKRA